jgi:hypothetical protein
VKNTTILAFLSLFYEGPNFFATGRIFWLIWQKSSERSWQHCFLPVEGGGTLRRFVARHSDQLKSRAYSLQLHAHVPNSLLPNSKKFFFNLKNQIE